MYQPLCLVSWFPNRQTPSWLEIWPFVSTIYWHELLHQDMRWLCSSPMFSSHYKTALLKLEWLDAMLSWKIPTSTTACNANNLRIWLLKHNAQKIFEQFTALHNICPYGQFRRKCNWIFYKKGNEVCIKPKYNTLHFVSPKLQWFLSMPHWHVISFLIVECHLTLLCPFQKIIYIIQTILYMEIGT